MLFERAIARAAVYPADVPARWGTTLVVAPHPDDESLGCGGAITLMRQDGQPVHVLFVSDGSMSHPHSQKYDARARRELREQEARNALAELGVSSSAITFLGLPDTRVPTEGTTGFEPAITLITQYLHQTRPDTILAPWRRDPHGDHRATWQLLRAAVGRAGYAVHWMEYPIWVWETNDPEDLPTTAEGTWYKLKVADVLSQKRRAIAAHRSQTTSLIDDDPEGFTLSPEMISHFTQSYEYYLEP